MPHCSQCSRLQCLLLLCCLLVFLHISLNGVPEFVGSMSMSYAESNVLEEVLLNSAAVEFTPTSPAGRHSPRGVTSTPTPANISLLNEQAIPNNYIDTSKTYAYTLQRRNLEYCPNTPPNLVGPIRVYTDGPSMKQLSPIYKHVEKGGHGFPASCRARYRVGIVIPYRDREAHLRILLHNLHGLLAKQQMDYVIFVVEQVANQTFNRAKLMNVGYMEGMKLYPFQCFIFHDVDLLPEDDRNLYSCPIQPRHMSVAVDKFNYVLPYKNIFGGISAMSVDHMQAINGFSNDYWGWGGEDDDLSTRTFLAGLKVSRYPQQIARYKMIRHGKEEANPVNGCRFKLMSRTKYRYKKDGLNSLRYVVKKLDKQPLYTRILVDLMEEESRKLLKQTVPSC